MLLSRRPLHRRVLFNEYLLPLPLPASRLGMVGKIGTVGKSVPLTGRTGEDANLGARRIATEAKVAVEATIKIGAADIVHSLSGNPLLAHGTRRGETSAIASFFAPWWFFP